MKVLLDECVPKDLRLHLTGHDCKTVPQAGLAGKKNGELLRLAEQAGWQVLVTVDQAMPDQQRLTPHSISLVIVLAKSNRLPDVLPHVAAILRTLRTIRPGETIQIT